MGYAQLQRFIERVLQKPSDPSVSKEELPSSEEEFVALCGMLSKKAAELKEAPKSIPEPPPYKGPKHPGPFTPSYELRSLYNKLERYEGRVEDAYEGGASKIVIEYVEGELEEVEREVAPVERREQQEHDKRIEEYWEARQPYRDRVRFWEDEVAKEERKRELEAERERTVERMYRKVKRAFEFGATVPTREVHWRFLPPGEVSNEHLFRHYENQQRRNPNVRYDLDRIRKALSLGPTGRWVEREKFGDYIVFTFPFTSSALMECPIVGNAIYLLHTDPERWSGTPKQQLIAEADRGGEVARIPHQGDWFEKVKRELGIE